MTADLHDQLRRRTCQELIRAEGAAACVRSDPGIFGFCNNNILVALLIGCFNGNIDACQLAYFLNMPIQLLVCRFWDLIFKAIYDNVISCGTQGDNDPMIRLPLLFIKHPVADVLRADTAVVGEP